MYFDESGDVVSAIKTRHANFFARFTLSVKIKTLLLVALPMIGLIGVGVAAYLGNVAVQEGNQKRAATSALSLISFNLISGSAELQSMSLQAFQEPSKAAEDRFVARLQTLKSALPASETYSASALARIVTDLDGVGDKFLGLTQLNEEFGHTSKQGVQKAFVDLGRDMDRSVRSLLVGAGGSGSFGLLEALLVMRRIASDFRLTRDHKLIDAFADEKKAFVDALTDSSATDEHRSTLKLLIDGYDAAFQRWTALQMQRVDAFNALATSIADLQNEASMLNAGAAKTSDEASDEMASQISKAALGSAAVIVARAATYSRA